MNSGDTLKSSEKLRLDRKKRESGRSSTRRSSELKGTLLGVSSVGNEGRKKHLFDDLGLLRALLVWAGLKGSNKPRNES